MAGKCLVLLAGLSCSSAFVGVPIRYSKGLTNVRANGALPTKRFRLLRPLAQSMVAEPPVITEIEEIQASFTPPEPVEGGSEVEKKPLSAFEVGCEYDGVVANVMTYGAFVDIGAEINGLVHISQMADEFVSSASSIVSEGDAVKVKVISVDGAEGKLELTMRHNKRTAPLQSTADVAKYSAILATDPGRFLDGVVQSIVSYGAFVKMDDEVVAFLHITQLKPKSERVNDINTVLTVGQEIKVRIREVDEVLKRVNLSLLPLPSFFAATKDVSKWADADKTEMRTGTVSAVQEYGVFVSLGDVDGLVHCSKMVEGQKLSPDAVRERFQQGQEVSVRILNVDTITQKLSLTMLPHEPSVKFDKYLSVPPETWIEGTVASTTAYGAFIKLDDSVDGLVHISELADKRVNSVEEVVSVGQTVQVRILECVPEKGKVRLSMRQPNSEKAPRGGGRIDRSKRNLDAYAEMSPSEWLEGTVRTLTKFGAFVQLGDDVGVDGLVHLSQLADRRIEEVSEIVSVGDKVRVRVLGVDKEEGKIALSMREESDRPSRSDGQESVGDESRPSKPRGERRRSSGKRDVTGLASTFDPQEFVPGKVVSMLPYGCFVELENTGGITGLLHISRLAEGRVESVEDVVQLDQAISVRICGVNVDAGTVDLSMVAYSEGEASSGRGGDSDNDNDEEGGQARRKSPRARFNEFSGGSGMGQGSGSKGEGEWQSYLTQYFEKK